jgi:ribonuclease HI
MKLSQLHHIVAYSDGGSLNNQSSDCVGYGSFSVYAVDGDGNRELGKSEKLEFGNSHNNECELLSLYKLMVYLDELKKRVGKNVPVVVYIDSRWLWGQCCMEHKLKSLTHLQPMKNFIVQMVIDGVDLHWISGKEMKGILGH